MFGIECEARHGGTPPAENFSSLDLAALNLIRPLSREAGRTRAS